jgi:hypothetical protein
MTTPKMAVQALVNDSTSATSFVYENCSSVCGYTNGLLTSETITDPVTGNVYKQSFTRNADGTLNTTSLWVKQ